MGVISNNVWSSRSDSNGLFLVAIGDVGSKVVGSGKYLESNLTCRKLTRYLTF